jgi:hypothetical protein
LLLKVLFFPFSIFAAIFSGMFFAMFSMFTEVFAIRPFARIAGSMCGEFMLEATGKRVYYERKQAGGCGRTGCLLLGCWLLAVGQVCRSLGVATLSAWSAST